MAQQVIGVGLAEGDQQGDRGRAAFGKVNTNFTELYSTTASHTTSIGVLNGYFAATAAETAAAVTITALGYEPYDLRRYGVDFNDSSSLATSNTTILNALGAAAWTSDITFYWPAGKCRINNTVTFSNIHISHYFESRSSIEYYGTTDRVAVVMGNASTAQGTKQAIGGAGIIVVNNTTKSYTDEAFIGLQILGTFQNSTAIIRQINGFTIGLQLRPSTSGIAYSEFYLYSLLDNKYHIDIHSFAASCFCNENTFHNGSFRTSSMSALVDSIGVRFKAESGAYNLHNRNIFIKPSFELDATSATSAGVTRAPVLYSEAGQRNEFKNARVESGRGYIVDIVATTVQVAGNSFEGVVLSGSWTAYQRESDGGVSYGNVFTDIVDGREFQKPTWSSGDLVKKAFNTDTAKISVKGAFFQATGSQVATYTGSGKIFKDYVVVTNGNNAIGWEVDSSYYKSFLLRKDFRSGFGGRTRIVCYDSTGTLLDSGGAGHPYATNAASFAGAATYGYSYGTQSDASGGGLYFNVGSAVAKFRLLQVGGSAAIHLRGVELYALTNFDNPKPLRITAAGLSQSHDEWYPVVIPTTSLGGGFVARGQRVSNGVAASGVTSGWVVTAEGWLAAAWVLSTAYLIGQLVNNDTGKTYECLTAGTSAGATGPTGTATSGITDNTVVWGYIGTQATVAALANLP